MVIVRDGPFKGVPHDWEAKTETASYIIARRLSADCWVINTRRLLEDPAPGSIGVEFELTSVGATKLRRRC
jgi:hypothetical protein